MSLPLAELQFKALNWLKNLSIFMFLIKYFASMRLMGLGSQLFILNLNTKVTCGVALHASRSNMPG